MKRYSKDMAFTKAGKRLPCRTVARTCADEYVQQFEQSWQGDRFVSLSCEPDISVFKGQAYCPQLFFVMMNRQIPMAR